MLSIPMPWTLRLMWDISVNQEACMPVVISLRFWGLRQTFGFSHCVTWASPFYSVLGQFEFRYSGPTISRPTILFVDYTSNCKQSPNKGKHCPSSIRSKLFVRHKNGQKIMSEAHYPREHFKDALRIFSLDNIQLNYYSAESQELPHEITKLPSITLQPITTGEK